MLWISWQARTQSPQRTHLFWSRTSSWSKQMRSLRRLRPCLSWNSKHWSNWFRGVNHNHGALDHDYSPAYFKLTAWIAAWYAYVHGHTRTHWPQSTQSTWGLSSKLLSTSSLTINAPLIVKDEVDKVFELILFATKQKILCGLKAYCYLGPACPGALEGPRDRRVHDYYSNRIVII